VKPLAKLPLLSAGTHSVYAVVFQDKDDNDDDHDDDDYAPSSTTTINSVPALSTCFSNLSCGTPL